MSYILFSFLVIIIIRSLTLAIEKLYHSNNGCYLLWKNRICCWQSLLWIFHVQNAYAPPTLNLHTLCPLQICDKCSPVWTTSGLPLSMSDFQFAGLNMSYKLCCTNVCSFFLPFLQNNPALPQRLFFISHARCTFVTITKVVWYQRRIFHFLQNMSWFCKNPTAISEHVIFLPSLCAADGLKDCVFILSQKSAKKTLFSAELKLKPGKKLAKHSLAS